METRNRAQLVLDQVQQLEVAVTLRVHFQATLESFLPKPNLAFYSSIMRARRMPSGHFSLSLVTTPKLAKLNIGWRKSYTNKKLILNQVLPIQT